MLARDGGFKEISSLNVVNIVRSDRQQVRFLRLCRRVAEDDSNGRRDRKAVASIESAPKLVNA